MIDCICQSPYNTSTPVKAVIVYLQCMFRDSHFYFSAMRLKSGGYGTPTPKSGGYAYPPYPPKVTPMF